MSFEIKTLLITGIIVLSVGVLVFVCAVLFEVFKCYFMSDKLYDGKFDSISAIHRELFEIVKSEMDIHFYNPKSYVKAYKLTKKLAKVIEVEKIR